MNTYQQSPHVDKSAVKMVDHAKLLANTLQADNKMQVNVGFQANATHNNTNMPQALKMASQVLATPFQ
jgi:hypothetical protein